MPGSPTRSPATDHDPPSRRHNCSSPEILVLTPITLDVEGAIHDLIGIVHVSARRVFIIEFLFEGSAATSAWSSGSEYLAAETNTVALPAVEM